MRTARMMVLALSVVLMLSVSAWGDVAVNAENFPDEVFRSYVSSNFDTDNNDVLSDSEIAAATSIRVDNMDIASLKGVECFSALKYLYCDSNQLNALDVSNNTTLTRLECDNNQLIALDLTNNLSLEIVSCYGNQLTALDVSNNTVLTELNCGGNYLTALDVSNNTALEQLSCPDNPLTAIDLTNNTALASLNCDSNDLAALDVSNNTALRWLSCSDNQLTSLDVSNNTALKTLTCTGNQLTSLDVSNNTALTDLLCDVNQLSTLDVSNNTALTTLWCYSNQLTVLDLSSNVSLDTLDCSPQTLAVSLDATGNASYPYSVNLSGLNASLDISKVSVSSVLDFEGTDLTYNLDSSAGVIYFTYAPSTMVYTYGTGYNSETMDVTLTFSGVSGDSGVEINATNFPDEVFRSYVSSNFDTNSSGILSESEIANATGINVQEAGITTLKGVEYFTALTQLYCGINQLTSLDVSKNTALEYLYCDSNQLTTLDVSKNIALTRLSCSDNQLMTLDVSANTALTEFDCSSNQLTTLDVSNNTALTSLHCGNNQLTALDLSNNTALTYVYPTSQARAVSIDVTGDTTYPYSLNLAGLNASLDVSKVTISSVYDSNSSSVHYSMSSSTGIVYFASAPSTLTYYYTTGYGSNTMDVTLSLSYSVLDAIAQAFGVSPSELINAENLSGATYPDWSDALANAQTYANANDYFIITTDIPAITGLSSGTYYIADVSFLTPAETLTASADFEFFPNGFGNGSSTVSVFDSNGVKLTPETAKGTTGNYVVFNTDGDMSAPILAVKQQASPEVVEINATNFPDEIFREYVRASFDVNSNSSLSEAEIAAATTIDVHGMGIASLKGVEYFSALEYLYCYSNDIVSLDLSNNTALYRLECYGTYNYTTYTYNGKITSLNVSGCTALRYLSCYGNQLTTLDVSNNTELYSLSCGSNQLTTLDVSNNTELYYLDCYGNQLTTLDVSSNTELYDLSCANNQLTTLDVSNNTELYYLSCANNQLTTLDVSSNTELYDLYCYGNQLTTLDVSNNTELYYLNCNYNQLTSLNVNGATALEYLSCSSNQLTTLDVSNNTELHSLSCSSNQLTTLDVSSNTDLESLSCSSNQLTELDVSSNTALESLYCSSNQLTELDVSANTALESLSCYSNQLTSLNLNGATALRDLDCYSNQLTELDVSTNTALWHLDCYSNQLTTLDVSSNTDLETLNCGYNSLGTIDLSHNTKLTSLYVASIDMTPSAIDLTNNTTLKVLNISYNTAITSLDFTGFQLGSLYVYGCIGLVSLDCSGNSLGTLTISNNNALTSLNCEGQEITFVDVLTETTSDDWPYRVEMDTLYSNGYLPYDWREQMYNALTSSSSSTNISSLEILDESGNSVSASRRDTYYRRVYFSAKPATMTYNYSTGYSGSGGSMPVTITFSDVSVEGVSLTSGHFPDSTFRSIITASFDVDGNGYLSDSEIASVTSLNLSGKGISDLTGIRYFTSVTHLDCSDNSLTSINLTYNTALTYLDVSNNGLTTLDVSKCTALQTLRCYSNELTALDLSTNTALTDIDVSSNGLTELDINTNTALQYLRCYSNQLTTLDLSTNTALMLVECDDNQLTALDLSNNLSLSSLGCTSNCIAALDVSANTSLASISCGSQDLTVTSLDYTGRSDYPCSINLTEMRDALGLSVDVAYYVASVYSLDIRDSEGEIVTHSTDVDAGVVYFAGKPATISYCYDTGYTGSSSETMDVTVSVESPALTVTLSPESQNVTVGSSITAIAITVSNAWVSYDVSASNLPSGLTLSDDTITGTISSTGTYTFTVTAKDSGGYTASTTGTIIVNAAPSPEPSGITAIAITNPAAKSITLSADGGTFSATLSASGTVYGSIAWSATPTADLTAEISGSGTTATLSGTAQPNTTSADRTGTITITARDSIGTDYTDTLTVIVGGIAISSDVISGDIVSPDISPDIPPDVSPDVSPDITPDNPDEPGQDDPGEHDGSSWSSARRISSPSDFLNILASFSVNMYVIITEDIDLSNVPNRQPIGTEAQPFTGHFDGGGKTITYTAGTVSIFGIVSSDGIAIQNLNVVARRNINNRAGGSDTPPETFAGGIVQELVSGTIDSCTFTGNVNASGENSSAGGIVGELSGGNITNCRVLDGSGVYATHSAGGIAGYVSAGTISGCSSSAQVEAEYTGGIAGYTETERRNITSNTYTAAALEVGNDALTLELAPTSQDVTAGDSITDIVISGDNLSAWSFTVSGDFALGLTSTDTAITGTIPHDTPAGLYALTVNAANTNGFTASAQAFINVAGPEIPDTPDRPGGTNRVIHSFGIPDRVRSSVASRFRNAQIFQFSDEEIDYRVWELADDDTQALSGRGERVVLLLPQMSPRNSGVYLLRLTLGEVSSGTNINLHAITGSGQVSASALAEIDHVFLDEEGREVTRVPEDGIVYVAMNLTSGRTHRGVITSPRELERGTIEAVELAPSIVEKIAEAVSVSADAIKFITDENISDPQEPTPGMRDELSSQNAEIIGKLNTLTMSVTGYYVFKVTLSDDLYEQIKGISINELRAYALYDDGRGGSRPEGANVGASFISGLLSTWELLSLNGERLEFGAREFLMVGLLNAGTPFSVYITKLLIMLLMGGCDAGLGLAGLAALGLGAVFFTRRRH